MYGLAAASIHCRLHKIICGLHKIYAVMLRKDRYVNMTLSNQTSHYICKYIRISNWWTAAFLWNLHVKWLSALISLVTHDALKIAGSG